MQRIKPAVELGSVPCVIAIDVGGTKIAGALVTQDGRIYDRVSIPTPTVSGAATASGVAVVATNLKSIGGERCIAVGVGTAGQVDPVNGVITYAVDTLPGWAGTPLIEKLRQYMNLPIAIENDVNAMAIGELRADAGVNSALFVAVGTGIGGALVVNGKLWQGANWSAGELGHVLVDYTRQRRCNCGDYGHLEAYAAGPAMARAYDGTDDLRAVAASAESGDARASQVIREGAEILGRTLSGLLCAFDPGTLIIGGGVPEIGVAWWNPFEAALRENPMPAVQRAVVRKATLGTDAVLIGAAALAWEKVR